MTGPQQQSNLDKDIEGWRLPQEEMNCRISAHPLFTIHGVSHFNIAQDAMHILFCKGVLSHCVGNALKFWCYTCKAVPGRSIRDKVKHIWQKIQSLYKDFEVDCRLPTLKLSMPAPTSLIRPSLSLGQKLGNAKHWCICLHNWQWSSMKEMKSPPRSWLSLKTWQLL